MSSVTSNTTSTNENSAPPSTILCPIERQNLEIKAKLAQLANKHFAHTTTSVSKPNAESPIQSSTPQPAPSTVKPAATAQDVIPKMQQPRRTRDGYNTHSFSQIKLNWLNQNVKHKQPN
ncbi:unnamed protein product [Caenorhabditis brenneri]